MNNNNRIKKALFNKKSKTKIKKVKILKIINNKFHNSSYLNKQ